MFCNDVVVCKLGAWVAEESTTRNSNQDDPWLCRSRSWKEGHYQLSSCSHVIVFGDVCLLISELILGDSKLSTALLGITTASIQLASFLLPSAATRVPLKLKRRRKG